jgi:hypothetical protein
MVTIAASRAVIAPLIAITVSVARGTTVWRSLRGSVIRAQGLDAITRSISAARKTDLVCW